MCIRKLFLWMIPSLSREGGKSLTCTVTQVKVVNKESVLYNRHLLVVYNDKKRETYICIIPQSENIKEILFNVPYTDVKVMAEVPGKEFHEAVYGQ